MIRRLTSLFVFFYCLYHHTFCDCFYIFDVGQGNSQLAVFEDEKIGILYDCGTISTQEHVKISALKQNDYHYFLQKSLTTNNQLKMNISSNEEILKKGVKENQDVITDKRVNEDRLSFKGRKRSMSRDLKDFSFRGKNIEKNIQKLLILTG